MRISEKIKQIVSEIYPSESSQIEATRRYDICEKCDQFKIIDNIERCDICKCSIRGKLFNPDAQCPLNKH